MAEQKLGAEPGRIDIMLGKVAGDPVEQPLYRPFLHAAIITRRNLQSTFLLSNLSFPPRIVVRGELGRESSFVHLNFCYLCLFRVLNLVLRVWATGPKGRDEIKGRN